MLSALKRKLIKIYYYLSYKDARRMSGKKVSFEHFRELNRSWLRQLKFNTVMDIGANEGQFAQLSRMVFPDCFIHSFEPLPECYEKLKLALKDDPKFNAHNVALGSEPSFLNFHRSDHSPSSSFLEMEDSHKEAFPESVKGHKELVRVEVSTLSSFFESYRPEAPILLKIDVQGFEREVLKGGMSILSNVSVIIIEMSLIKLYKDQPLFHDVYLLMYEAGFHYHGNLSQMLSAQTGEVVQIDAIFINEAKIK